MSAPLVTKHILFVGEIPFQFSKEVEGSSYLFHNNEFIDWIVDSAFEMDLGYRGLEKAISANVDEQLYDLISGDTKKFVYQKKIGKIKASDNN